MSANCIFPPELDDKQLLMYQEDPGVNQETARHLEKCAYCRNKLEELDHLEKHVKRHLYRASCPPPEALGEYHLRLLRASQMMIIGQHVRECPYCVKEITDLRKYLSELSQPGLLDSVKVFIADLISGTPTTPAYGGLRGNSKQSERYQADDVPIIIGVHDDKDHPGLKTVLGLIPGIGLRGFKVEMYQAGNLIASTLVDEIGNFLFTRLVPGLYELVLPGLDAQIRIPSVIV